MAPPDPIPPLARILIVDDDDDVRRLLARALQDEEPRHVVEAASATAARALITRRSFDVVVTDLAMPGEDGLSLMRWGKAHSPDASWIVLTGYGTFDSAVRALQLGAFEFLQKPLRSLEPLRHAVRKALADKRLRAERDRLQVELEDRNVRLRENVEELEEACEMLREQADVMGADLHRAAIIQRALLPRTAPRLPGFHVRGLYRPSHSVGGDLYDVVRLSAERALLLVADAAGHGLSAAMLAVLFRSRLPILEADSRTPRRPREVLRDVNRTLCEELPVGGLFLTAALCLLDTRLGRATIASAGHPPLLLRRADGQVERLYHTGPAVGLAASADFAEIEIELREGDRLLFYSDGLFEPFPGNGVSSLDRIEAALETRLPRGADPLRPLLEAVGADVDRDDDLTLLALVAGRGTSLLDNGALAPLPAPAPRESHCTILRGEASPARTALCIQGRADWTRSAVFHAACSAALDAGRDVLLDLSLCQHLDSTFLGTLHQLCEQAEQGRLELRLQGVLPRVEALFAELGMEGTLEHVVPAMLPLPMKMEPLDASVPDRPTQARLLLRAHEGLAGLSERNRREFDPLLRMLRRELGEERRP